MRAAAVAPDTAGCLCPSSSSKATESKPPWKTVTSRRSCKSPNLQSPSAPVGMWLNVGALACQSVKFRISEPQPCVIAQRKVSGGPCQTNRPFDRTHFAVKYV